MNMPLSKVTEGTVTTKPQQPMPHGPDWDVLSNCDGGKLQAEVEAAAEAEELEELC